MKNEELKKWLNDHNIRIVNSSKRIARVRKLDYFRISNDYNVIKDNINYETEALITLEVPESDLKNIAEFECQVFNNMREKGHYNIFQVMLEQKEEEKILRENNEAVKKAYEHYSLLLHLAKYGKE